MRLVTDINTRQELEEMKSIMEVFVISNRIKQIAVNM
jgi:hypothetical protein